jgi:ParB family chromosome partitioning protein
MGSDQVKSYGAARRVEGLWFDPDDLIIVTDKGHALYDPRVRLDIDEAMVASIMAAEGGGVHVPILVVKDGEESDGTPRVLVVDGRQRVRNAREANARLKKLGRPPVLVPAIPRRGDIGDLAGLGMLVNEIRKADPPLVRAGKMQHLLDIGQDLSAVALVFGVDPQTVKNTVKLLGLSRKARATVKSRALPVDVARKLAVLPADEQDAKLAELAEAGTLRGRAASESVERTVGDRGRTRAKRQTMRAYRDAADVLGMLTAAQKSDDNKDRRAWRALVLNVLRWTMGEDVPEAVDAFDQLRTIVDAKTSPAG